MCMIPEKWRHIRSAIDTNKDGKISQQEINDALKILEKARRESFMSSLKKK